MTDCVRGLLVMPLAAYSVDNTATVTNGADHLSGSMPAYQVYRTKGGGRLAVGSVEPKFWGKSCTYVKMMDLFTIMLTLMFSSLLSTLSPLNFVDLFVVSPSCRAIREGDW